MRIRGKTRPPSIRNRHKVNTARALRRGGYIEGTKVQQWRHPFNRTIGEHVLDHRFPAERAAVCLTRDDRGFQTTRDTFHDWLIAQSVCRWVIERGHLRDGSWLLRYAGGPGATLASPGQKARFLLPFAAGKQCGFSPTFQRITKDNKFPISSMKMKDSRTNLLHAKDEINRTFCLEFFDPRRRSRVTICEARERWEASRARYRKF